MTLEQPSKEEVAAIVAAALKEDRAWEDATTPATVDEGLWGHATFLAKQDGVACGFFCAETAFRLIDPRCTFEQTVAEGQRFRRGDSIAHVRGPARAILQAERVALNFVQRLSASATLTRAFVDLIAGTNAVIADAHKRAVYLPGLRVAPTLLVDGIVAGTWKIERKKDAATLSVTPFRPLPKAVVRETNEEAEALVRFAEPDATAWRIRVD